MHTPDLKIDEDFSVLDSAGIQVGFGPNKEDVQVVIDGETLSSLDLLTSFPPEFERAVEQISPHDPSSQQPLAQVIAQHGIRTRDERRLRRGALLTIDSPQIAELKEYCSNASERFEKLGILYRTSFDSCRYLSEEENILLIRDLWENTDFLDQYKKMGLGVENLIEISHAETLNGHAPLFYQILSRGILCGHYTEPLLEEMRAKFEKELAEDAEPDPEICSAAFESIRVWLDPSRDSFKAEQLSEALEISINSHKVRETICCVYALLLFGVSTEEILKELPAAEYDGRHSKVFALRNRLSDEATRWGIQDLSDFRTVYRALVTRDNLERMIKQREFINYIAEWITQLDA